MDTSDTKNDETFIWKGLKTDTIMMKFKVLFLLAITGLMSFSAMAQRGVRIGYIDTEYILQNVPEYQEATSQLDKKVLQWKSEIEQKLNVIEQKKKELENESVLLTKELYEERMEDISFEEAEILDYQQKRFGTWQCFRSCIHGAERCHGGIS